MPKKRLSIVIPVYNEIHSLSKLHKELHEALSSKYTTEYIYVDDSSTDGSFEKMNEIKNTYKTTLITLVKLRKHLGKSAALAVGFEQAKGDIVVTIDADLQDDPSEIPHLIDKLEEGYQLVSGWRVRRDDDSNKIALSRFFNTFVRLTTGIQLHDFNTGLKAFTKDVASEVTLYGELHRYIPVLAVARGFRVTEIPVNHRKRLHGKSKYGLRRVFQAGFDFIATMFLILFKERPLQLFGLTGSIAILSGTIVLVYLSTLHFLNQSIGRRPLLTLGVLLVLSGIQLVSTGLLAELFTHYTKPQKSYPIENIIR